MMQQLSTNLADVPLHSTRWLVRGFLPEAAIACIAGPPYEVRRVSDLIKLAVDAGIEFYGLRTRQAPVLETAILPVVPSPPPLSLTWLEYPPPGGERLIVCPYPTGRKSNPLFDRAQALARQGATVLFDAGMELPPALEGAADAVLTVTKDRIGHVWLTAALTGEPTPEPLRIT